jgi:hypothetical protein
MKNNKIYIGLAAFGFATQAFTFVCSNQLDAQTIINFNAFGMLSMFVSFLGFAINTSSDIDNINNNTDMLSEDFRRDFDSVYRHIDDIKRDVLDDITKMKYKKK